MAIGGNRTAHSPQRLKQQRLDDALSRVAQIVAHKLSDEHARADWQAVVCRPCDGTASLPGCRSGPTSPSSSWPTTTCARCPASSGRPAMRFLLTSPTRRCTTTTPACPTGRC
jgi:hypothetical protein